VADVFASDTSGNVLYNSMYRFLAVYYGPEMAVFAPSSRVLDLNLWDAQEHNRSVDHVYDDMAEVMSLAYVLPHAVMGYEKRELSPVTKWAPLADDLAPLTNALYKMRVPNTNSTVVWLVQRPVAPQPTWCLDVDQGQYALFEVRQCHTHTHTHTETETK
jgi:hypothetical protein